jgi:hypothetical protein
MAETPRKIRGGAEALPRQQADADRREENQDGKFAADRYVREGTHWLLRLVFWDSRLNGIFR